jgi:hypothetical protein
LPTSNRRAVLERSTSYPLLGLTPVSLAIIFGEN